MSRRALISLGIGMIVILVLLMVERVVSVILQRPDSGGAAHWTLFALGLLFLILVVAGVVVYLTLSIKAINLTRRQSNFVDSVTHELKSPIASLKLYLQTLSRRPVNAEEQAEFYEFMLEDVERLDLLINHILSAARLEKKYVPGDAELIDLEQLLTDCTRDVCLQYRVPLETVALELQPCRIHGNRVDLELIFRNLLDNAIKYAAYEKPEVRVVAHFHPEKGNAVVRISDNGPGIPGPLRRKVFGRFVRLGTELERKKPGTGLGLYIVRTLVHRWKGRVRVSSRDGETGTVFEVSLPNASAGTRDADVKSDPIVAQEVGTTTPSAGPDTVPSNALAPEGGSPAEISLDRAPS